MYSTKLSYSISKRIFTLIRMASALYNSVSLYYYVCGKQLNQFPHFHSPPTFRNLPQNYCRHRCDCSATPNYPVLPVDWNLDFPGWSDNYYNYSLADRHRISKSSVEPWGVSWSFVAALLPDRRQLVSSTNLRLMNLWAVVSRLAVYPDRNMEMAFVAEELLRRPFESLQQQKSQVFETNSKFQYIII